MPRTARNTPGNHYYHVLNRATGARKLFSSKPDLALFYRCLQEAHAAVPGCRILGWVILPTAFHLVLHPRKDADLTTFMRKLTMAHAVRWNTAHGTVGDGPVYSGRFRSFPIEPAALPNLLRLLHRTPQRLKLAKGSAAYPHSSHTHQQGRSELAAMLDDATPKLSAKEFARPESEAELAALTNSLNKGTPFGSPAWTVKTAHKLNLTQSLRAPGRPKGSKDKQKRTRTKKR